MLDDERFWVALFGFLIVLVNAVSSIINGRRLNKTNERIEKVDAAQRDAHIETNSRLTQLIDAEKRAAGAEGLAAGRADRANAESEKLSEVKSNLGGP